MGKSKGKTLSDTIKPSNMFHSITDCPRDAFMMELRSPQAGRVRHRTKIDYHGRGLFLVQYRMYGDYADISLSVTHNGKHVSSSPYFLGAVFHEDCACPLYYPGEWLSNFQCPEAEEQIVEDLKPFREGGGVNVTGLYERAGEMYARNSFVHYSIVGGKVSEGGREGGRRREEGREGEGGRKGGREKEGGSEEGREGEGGGREKEGR